MSSGSSTMVCSVAGAQRWLTVTMAFFSESFYEFARLVKRKSALRIVDPDEVKYLKGTETPWDWFLWDIENV